MEIYDGASGADPFLLRLDVSFGVRGFGYIEGQNGSVGHEGPAFFGVAVVLARVAEVGPGEGFGIEFGDALVEFASQKVFAIGQNDRWRISDEAPAVGRLLFGPGIFHRIVDCAHVGE